MLIPEYESNYKYFGYLFDCSCSNTVIAQVEYLYKLFKYLNDFACGRNDTTLHFSKTSTIHIIFFLLL